MLPWLGLVPKQSSTGRKQKLGAITRMNIMVVAEGIETIEEITTLRNMGIRYIQGYLLARPGFKVLPIYDVPQPVGMKQIA